MCCRMFPPQVVLLRDQDAAARDRSFVYGLSCSLRPIATFNRVTTFVQAPIASSSGYDLGGSSRSAK
jgi:hypothetical protein